jgi:hypothetical protein
VAARDLASRADKAAIERVPVETKIDDETLTSCRKRSAELNDFE